MGAGVELPYDDAVPTSGTPSVSRPPERGDDWTALVAGGLPVGDAYAWAVRPDCGAVVVFTGTARDHSAGRPDVTELAYEAYEDHAVARMDRVVDELRRRWPAAGRVAVLHRVGDVPIGQEAVVVAVSAPHRAEAFDAARFAIDAVKESVPVWKRERWAGGQDWGSDARSVVGADQVGADQVGADPVGTTRP